MVTVNRRRAYSYIGDTNPVMVDGGLSDHSNGRIFNVGSSEDVSINQLADVVRDVFFDGGPWPAGLEPKYMPGRPLEVRNAYCAHEAAEQILGFRNTTTLREGVEAMVRWAREVRRARADLSAGQPSKSAANAPPQPGASS